MSCNQESRKEDGGLAEAAEPSPAQAAIEPASDAKDTKEGCRRPGPPAATQQLPRLPACPPHPGSPSPRRSPRRGLIPLPAPGTGSPSPLCLGRAPALLDAPGPARGTVLPAPKVRE